MSRPHTLSDSPNPSRKFPAFAKRLIKSLAARFALAGAQNENHIAGAHRPLRRWADDVHLGQRHPDGRIGTLFRSAAGGSGLDLVPVGSCEICRTGRVSSCGLALGPRAALRRPDESILYARFVAGPGP